MKDKPSDYPFVAKRIMIKILEILKEYKENNIKN